MIHAVALVLCLLAFAALALTTERQQADLFGGPLSRRSTLLLRLAGWIAMFIALASLVTAQGWGLGLVSYSGHTSLAAGLVWSALIVYGRRRDRR
ncbi:DUF3325 family protein [Hylemonella sp. W303a]|uniref:DUF3325 family protein n=1 Tax=Hylemonella sp. W303a TaxID=3389873 RepID=UPI00396B2D1A